MADPKTPKLRSPFFRVAVEGATSDGRQIERAWIEQAAASYNPKTYGARIWMEHIRSSVADSPFKAYGDVVAVKAEEVEINGQKKLALFAQIEPTADLVALNKAKQKIYTSIEISPKFADTGAAYLVGLGITDSPASLGTDVLSFAAANPAGNPYAGRKQHADNLFTVAEETALPVAAVQAVNEVESKGEGFLDNGKVVILFERHVFYQRLVKAHGQAEADRLAALNPNLINPKSGGYAGGAAEWQRLTSARQIDEACALESCSWGLFQVMGYHWQNLGYANVQDFVTRMQASEAEQLEAFVRFVKAEPALLKALKAGKWADFARGYNGPAYARNLYDVKLERAFARYSAAAPAKDAA